MESIRNHRLIEQAPAEPCANCGAAVTGPFCAACGQPTRSRLTMGSLAGSLAELFDLHRGVFATALDLFRNPGVVIRDYLRGRTVRYTNPVKHFALVLSLVQLAALFAGSTGEFVSGFAEGHRGGVGAAAAARTLDRFFVLLAAPAVPLLAGVQRVVFRRAKLTFPEHLVFALFVSAQQLIFWLPAVLMMGAHNAKFAGAVLVLASLVVTTAYYAWAARAVFGGSRGGVVTRSIIALLITGAVYLMALSALLVLVFGA